MKCENCVRPDPCGGRVNEDGECGLHRTAEEWRREHADPHEPISAILAEMRDERIIRIDDADVTRCLLQNLADRIEAAYKREHAEWHAETEAAKEARNRVACRMRTAFSKKCRSCAANLRRVVYAVCDDCDSLLSAFHPMMGIAMKPDKETFETMLSDVDAARCLVQHIDDHPTLTEEQNV